jgi:hypothetical protein
MHVSSPSHAAEALMFLYIHPSNTILAVSHIQMTDIANFSPYKKYDSSETSYHKLNEDVGIYLSQHTLSRTYTVLN